MADPEHVERLKRNVEEWNQWRREHPEIRSDLSAANLSGAKLGLANLKGANLSKASLMGVDFNRANLQKADLSGSNLRGTNLLLTNLRNANLRGVNFWDAHLGHLPVGFADLRNADLSNADLSGVDFSHVNLSGTNLSGAELGGVNFTSAHLNDVNFTGTVLIGTAFGDRDLRVVKGLETVIHRGPSPLSINTLYLSRGAIPEVFVRGTGAPDSFIEYMRSLVAMPIQYYSLFISYAHQDETVACRLHQDLQDNGVRCWMAPRDLRPGDYHHSRIDEAIHLHEKTLLLLSEHAVNSLWVKHEVQVTLAREIARDCMVLFPLRLDEAVMHTNKDWAARLRESRHIGDFTNWQEDAAYQEAFSRLLRDLKVTRPPTG